MISVLFLIANYQLEKNHPSIHPFTFIVVFLFLSEINISIAIVFRWLVFLPEIYIYLFFSPIRIFLSLSLPSPFVAD